MKPQARPFSVELKSRRRPLQSPHASWSTIDEPSPDDLPTRDLREDQSSADGDQSPLTAANRVFGALTSQAVSTAATLATTAASVFAPKQDAGHDASPVTEPATDQGRTGRILPSLLPINPFEDASEPKALPKRRKPRAKSVVLVNDPTLASDESVMAGNTGPALVMTDLAGKLAEPTAPKARTPRRRRAERRVPAGERWKRRRLPKALW
jgi:cytoskeletal protein RodZ